MHTKDQNNLPVPADIRRERDGWGVTVTIGYPFASVIRRYVYATRAQARCGDISDAPGERGRIS